MQVSAIDERFGMRRVPQGQPVVSAIARTLPKVVAMLCMCSAAHAQLELTGLDEPLRENALTHLELDDESCDAAMWRIREQFSRAEQQIRTGLEAYGFYASEISANLAFGVECWTAQFEVDPGEPVRLRNVSIAVTGQASSDPEFSALAQSSTLRPGEPLSHAEYERVKRALLDLALYRGYAEAAYTVNRIDVYPQEGVADVELRFNSGPRYSFGEIEINQDALDRSVVEGYYDFRSGDPYDRDRLTALYGALVGSGYFRAVDVFPLPADPVSRQIPIEVDLSAGGRRAWSYGIGFSTDTGPRIRFGRTDRRVNSRGAQLGVDGLLSPVASELSFNYRFPYGNPRSEWVSLNTGLMHEKTDTSTSDTLELGIRRVVSRRSSWQETQFLDLTVEDFEVGDIESRSRLLTPGISWYRVDADTAIRPDRGNRLGLEISAANDSLGSDTDFIQIDASGKWIWSFENRSRLLLRARLGVTRQRNFDELPASVRFFAGGDNSIRGYGFESLGPIDENGAVIGGDRLAVASIEYEVPIRRRWSAAVFIDSGNAFQSGNFEAKTGAGFGVRWQSPLGPIRVDLAWPIDDAMEDDPRLHVSLGADL